jgi:uncharacterized membrane protein
MAAAQFSRQALIPSPIFPGCFPRRISFSTHAIKNNSEPSPFLDDLPMKEAIELGIKKLVRCFMAGLLAVLPLILTVAIVSWVVSFLQSFIGPSTYFGQFLSSLGLRLFIEADRATVGSGRETAEAFEGGILAYSLGVVIVVLVLFGIGVLVEFGARRYLASWSDRFIRRIPLIGGLYGSLKQLVDLFDKRDEAQIKAMSVVYCHFSEGGGPGVLALMPSAEKIVINNEEHYIVIIPTAPVPFGGGLVFFPTRQVTFSEMAVESLISIYVSMGVSTPQFMKIVGQATQNLPPTH